LFRYEEAFDGINAGIFYEDEVDITGVRNDRFDRRKPGLLSLELNSEHKGDDPNMLVLELLLGQFTVPYSSPSGKMESLSTQVISVHKTLHFEMMFTPIKQKKKTTYKIKKSRPPYEFL
jgi:mediator of RNA polymerase II transcription subunit 13